MAATTNLSPFGLSRRVPVDAGREDQLSGGTGPFALRYRLCRVSHVPDGDTLVIPRTQSRRTSSSNLSKTVAGGAGFEPQTGGARVWKPCADPEAPDLGVPEDGLRVAGRGQSVGKVAAKATSCTTASAADVLRVTQADDRQARFAVDARDGAGRGQAAARRGHRRPRSSDGAPGEPQGADLQPKASATKRPRR